MSDSGKALNKLIIQKSGFFYEIIGNDALIFSKYFGYKLYIDYNTQKYKTGFPVKHLNVILEKLDLSQIIYAVTERENESPIIEKSFDNNQYEIIDESLLIPNEKAFVFPEPPKFPKGNAKYDLNLFIETLNAFCSNVNYFSGEVITGVSKESKNSFNQMLNYFKSKQDSKNKTAQKYTRLGQKWDVEEKELLKQEIDKGFSIKEIAQLHNRSTGAITSQLLKMGYITSNMNSEFSNKNISSEKEIVSGTSEIAEEVEESFTANNLTNKDEDYKAKSNSDQNYTCKNCLSYKKEECFGKPVTCKDFKYAPNMTEEKKQNWPKFGDATAFRLKRFNNR